MDSMDLMKELRRKGYKVTPQRMAICDTLLNSRDHPTAEQVYLSLKKRYPSISMATVYQVLHLLTEMGMVQELGFSGWNSRYDPNVKPHVNVVCRACGKIVDYNDQGSTALIEKLLHGLDFEPVGIRIDVYKICEECKNCLNKRFGTSKAGSL